MRRIFLLLFQLKDSFLATYIILIPVSKPSLLVLVPILSTVGSKNLGERTSCEVVPPTPSPLCKRVKGFKSSIIVNRDSLTQSCFPNQVPFVWYIFLEGVTTICSHACSPFCSEPKSSITGEIVSTLYSSFGSVSNS